MDGWLKPSMPLLNDVLCYTGYTAVLYDMTKTVGHVLSLTLTLHHTLAPGLTKVKANDPGSHKFDNAPPEVAFAAVVIIVAKMVYGLDGGEER